MATQNERINTAVWALRQAEANLKTVLVEEQAKCEHRHVLEAPWKPSDWFPSSPPMRICRDCGLEEHAMSSFGSWPGDVTYPGEGKRHRARLNTEFIKHVSRDEFWKERIG